MATAKKQVKPTSVKKVGKKEEAKTKTSVAASKKVVAVDPKTTPKKSKEKDLYIDQKEVKKAAEAQKKEEAKKAEKEKTKAKPKADTKTTSMKVDDKKTVVIPMPIKKTTTGKTVYHVSKRDNNGREWKVFIQGSSKVIQLFDTQLEALEYAKKIAKNKDDGSYVLLHGLDGKIRKY